jgi:adenosine kinase
MSILIAGSLAFDEVWYVESHSDTELDASLKHSWSFVAKTRMAYAGGCAGNVTLALSRLGFKVDIIASVGHDFAPYGRTLREANADLSQVKVSNDDITAQCCIIAIDRQRHITTFLPGAASHSDEIKSRIDPDHELGVILPETRSAMTMRLREFSSGSLRTIFSPSQAVSQLRREDRDLIIQASSLIILNAAEWDDLSTVINASKSDIASRGTACIETRGKDGSTIFLDTDVVPIPAVQSMPTMDPLGCGDAYLAGVCAELVSGGDLVTAAMLGSIFASVNVKYQGCQTYITNLRKDQLRDAFYAAFSRVPRALEDEP